MRSVPLRRGCARPVLDERLDRLLRGLGFAEPIGVLRVRRFKLEARCKRVDRVARFFEVIFWKVQSGFDRGPCVGRDECLRGGHRGDDLRGEEVAAGRCGPRVCAFAGGDEGGMTGRQRALGVMLTGGARRVRRNDEWGDVTVLTRVGDLILVLDGSSRHLRDRSAHHVASSRVRVPRASPLVLRGGSGMGMTVGWGGG